MRRQGKDQQRAREDLRPTLPGGAAYKQGGCASTMMLEQDREIVSFFLWGDRRITFTFSGCVGPASLKALVLKATGLCRGSSCELYESAFDRVQDVHWQKIQPELDGTRQLCLASPVREDEAKVAELLQSATTPKADVAAAVETGDSKAFTYGAPGGSSAAPARCEIAVKEMWPLRFADRWAATFAKAKPARRISGKLPPREVDLTASTPTAPAAARQAKPARRFKRKLKPKVQPTGSTRKAAPASLQEALGLDASAVRRLAVQLRSLPKAELERRLRVLWGIDGAEEVPARKRARRSTAQKPTKLDRASKAFALSMTPSSSSGEAYVMPEPEVELFGLACADAGRCTTDASSLGPYEKPARQDAVGRRLVLFLRQPRHAFFIESLDLTLAPISALESAELHEALRAAMPRLSSVVLPTDGWSAPAERKRVLANLSTAVEAPLPDGMLSKLVTGVLQGRAAGTHDPGKGRKKEPECSDGDGGRSSLSQAGDASSASAVGSPVRSPEHSRDSELVSPFPEGPKFCVPRAAGGGNGRLPPRPGNSRWEWDRDDPALAVARNACVAASVSCGRA
ncbi:hypothetical protein AK812_SmicGene15730 [Symbiodinium microadriaticum]|uniref:Uncharacterized protein n=1 Tax=Symbiodinium microadriaticum TaxID=2951 RepID=A0A1Q9E279_SYMMI|nr:hypothetical protein AK812_SmicGene15730 [Symbiodinium microadriaticum]